MFDSIALSAGKAAAEMIGNALTFWVGTETVNPDSPAVQNLQRYTVPVSAVILTGSVMVQGIRMMLSRKKDPLIAVAVDLIRYAVVSAIGLTTLALGVRAADAIAQALVDQGINDYAERMKVMFGRGHRHRQRASRCSCWPWSGSCSGCCSGCSRSSGPPGCWSSPRC